MILLLSVMLSGIVLCYAMLCHVMLCCVKLCSAMLSAPVPLETPGPEAPRKGRFIVMRWCLKHINNPGSLHNSTLPSAIPNSPTVTLGTVLDLSV